MATEEQASVFVVKAEAHGQRLDRYLSEMLDDSSRTLIQKQIEKNAVLVNEQAPTRASRTLIKTGDTIRYCPPPPERIEVVGENIPIEIIYQDDDLIVVNKPANLVVHPAIGHRSGTLVNALIYHIKDFETPTDEVRPGIVHRLDRDTTGLMVVAKHRTAQKRLAELFQKRQVNKSYRAIIRGVPKDAEGSFKTYYGRHPRDRKRFSSLLLSGKEAVTHYEIAEIFLGCSAVDIQLETGRTHQIRVHFCDHGHPLIGDPVYGARRRSKDPRLVPILSTFSRPALHASRLSFRHPMTKKKVSFESELPDDLEKLHQALRAITLVSR